MGLLWTIKRLEQVSRCAQMNSESNNSNQAITAPTNPLKRSLRVIIFSTYRTEVQKILLGIQPSSRDHHNIPPSPKSNFLPNFCEKRFLLGSAVKSGARGEASASFSNPFSPLAPSGNAVLIPDPIENRESESSIEGFVTEVGEFNQCQVDHWSNAISRASLGPSAWHQRPLR